MRVCVSAQFLLLERSWHRSQGKGGPNERPLKPTPDLIIFRLRLVGIYPVLVDSDFRNKKGGICAPEDLPLRQSSYPSRMKDLPRPRRLGRGGI
jgi:hypothetical protein